MATIERFEDMLAWQKARELTRTIYEEIFKNLKFKNDYGLSNQIQRAAVSVMSNIAEGFESGTRQEFLNYLYIAKGSAGEVRAQLYAALDIGYLNIETFKYLNNLVVECSKLISSFISKLKSGGKEGLQFKREKTKRQVESEKFRDETLEGLKKDSPDIYDKYFKRDT